ncbi:MAG: hypothetical protein H8D94_01235 [Candidatus Pelagibacter sp.]|nr:hypothetical protein [Candidatus Pelagibacter sp.]
MENRLSTFGHNFQIKSISSLMSDGNFLAQIYDILDESHYDNDTLKWIIKQCKIYYDEYKKPITFDVFKVKTGEVKNDILKASIVENLKEVFRYMEAPDLEFVKDQTLDFFKNQALKNAIIESVDILESSGDYDAIKTLVDTALTAGIERNIGHEYIHDIDARYSETTRVTVETGWDVVNELTQGGLGAGELGVIVAPAGIGKSWVLQAIAANAVKSGKNIVHYTLELNEEYTGLRYDSIFTGVANQNLKYHKDEVENEVGKLKGELIIKYFPTKTASVNTLSAHLQRMITLGKDVDMVVVDYADIMKDMSNSKEVRHALGNIYEDLRGLAGEFQFPIWTASQANRSALDEDVIEAQKISESYQKIMIADFVMSLSRKVEDKVANTGRFHIIKNRFGPDGITYPAMVNTNTGKIEIYDSTSVNGKQQQTKIDNRDNLMKKMLSNRYDDLMGE